MLFLDCSKGIAGDMFVGSLIDLGADKKKIIQALEGVAEINVSRTVKKGVNATRFKVKYSQKKALYPDLVETIKSIGLPDKAENTALSILGKLAEAESRAHEVELSRVHLHEAADSVVDAVASAVALHDLNLLGSKIRASTVSVGRLAPATAEIIKAYSIPIKYVSGEEITTPTGAAILASLVSDYSGDSYIEGSCGYGAGERDFSYPNVFRAVLGERLYMLESNIDDVSPEILSFVQERLLREGALDVHVVPCVMKKGRAGHLVRVLSSDVDGHARILMEETGTLGVRTIPVSGRIKSERETTTLSIKVGGETEKLRVKESEHGVKPEFDDVKKIAEKHGLTVKAVTDLILRRPPPS